MVSVSKQRGALLIAASFVIAIVGILGVGTLRLSGVTASGPGLSAMQARARYAASSGIAWAVQAIRTRPGQPICGSSAGTLEIKDRSAGTFSVRLGCTERRLASGQVIVDLHAVAESGTQATDTYFRAEQSVSFSPRHLGAYPLSDG